ncbi:MAG: hypothetical protein AAF639_21060 [Chloroflexota bacterium]
MNSRNWTFGQSNLGQFDLGRWLNDSMLPIIIIIMRTCWLWPWSVLLQAILTFTPLSESIQPAMSFGLVAIVPLSSFFVTRFLLAPVHRQNAEDELYNQQTVIPISTRLFVMGLGLIAILTALWFQLYSNAFFIMDPRWLAQLSVDLIRWPDAVPISFYVMLFVAFLWMAGILDAGRGLSHDAIWQTFGRGMIAFVLYFLIVVSNRSFMLDSQIVYLLMAFFAIGMAALAFSSLKITVGLDRALGRYGQQRSATRSLPISRHWFITVGTVILVLLGLSFLVSLLIAPDTVAGLLAILSRVAGFIWNIVANIIVAISYVLFLIFYYIYLLLQPLFQGLGGEREEEPFESAPAAEDATPTPPPVQDPIVVPDSYRWVAIVLLVLAILFVCALVLRRLNVIESEDEDEERESILSADLLQDQLSNLLGRFFGGLRPQDLSLFLRLDGEADTRRRIRQVYQDLLAKTDTIGYAHQPPQTSNEYQDFLERELDVNTVRSGSTVSFSSTVDENDMAELTNAQAVLENQLETITASYNEARYAPEPPSLDVAQKTQEAWASVEQSISPVSPADTNEDAEAS